MKKIHILGVFILFLSISFVLYLNTSPGEFVFDDDYFSRRIELRNPLYLTKIWSEPLTNINNLEYAETYRPFLVLTFVLNFLFFGEGAKSFHFVNIILNGSVSFILFLLVRKLFKNIPLAFFTALIFSFLPIHTEAVAFVKGREEVLAAGFMFLSWLMFLKTTAKNQISYLFLFLSSLFFFLGALSKELSAIFPGVFFTIFIIKEKPSLIRVLKLMSPFVVFGIVFLTMWYTSLGGKFPLENLHSPATNPIAYSDLLTRIWTVFAIVYLYISKTFIPINLSALYRFNHFPLAQTPFDFRTILGSLFLSVLFAPIFIKKLRNTPFYVGSIMFLISYFPISKSLFVGGEFIAERWIYLPSAGLSLIAAFFLAKLYKRWKIITVSVLVCVFIIYGAVIVNRNRVWLTPESLYVSMTKDAPNSVFGYTWLARYYLINKNYDEAEKNIIKAVKIYPEHNQVMAAYAAVLVHRRLYDEAEAAILKAILYKPDVSSYYYYALVLTKKGEYEKSQEVIENKLRNKMNESTIRFLAAVNYYKMDNEIQARKYFDWNSKLTEDEKIRAIREF